MNWEAIGAIGEIIGALAVFITLVYLAAQIRQNTAATRTSALDSSVSAVTGVRERIIDNEDVARIYASGSVDPETLSDIEKIRYRVLMTNILWSAWNFYSQSKHGGLSADLWECQKPALERILSNPGGHWYWSQFGNEFEESFVKEVDEIIDNARSSDDT